MKSFNLIFAQLSGKNPINCELGYNNKRGVLKRLFLLKTLVPSTRFELVTYRV